jgi:xanthine/uracil permease
VPHLTHVHAGSPAYIGMGFLTFSTIIIIEIFGSPFMRNASLVLALFFGTAISAAVQVSVDCRITSFDRHMIKAAAKQDVSWLV